MGHPYPLSIVLTLPPHLLPAPKTIHLVCSKGTLGESLISTTVLAANLIRSRFIQEDLFSVVGLGQELHVQRLAQWHYN